MRQSRAPTASQIQNPPPPPSSTKSGRLFGKGAFGEHFRLPPPGPVTIPIRDQHQPPTYRLRHPRRPRLTTPQDMPSARIPPAPLGLISLRS